MPGTPAFVPRELLRVPGFFGEQEDPVWIYAADLAGAVRLARAREQHELAFLMYYRSKELGLSIPDVAARLGVPRGNLGRKVAGYVPAQENDIITWCWFLDEQRRTYRPEELFGRSAQVFVPRLSIGR